MNGAMNRKERKNVYELTGKIKDFSVDFITGKAILTLAINEKQSVINCFDELSQCEKLSVEIDQYSDIRSREANNYMWVLCGELAKKLSNEDVHYTKDDIYKKAVRDSGIWRDDEVSPNDVQWRCASWERLGKGWVTERVDFSSDGEKEIIRFYYGSSVYNKKQMSRLIDGIVQDCKAVGVETKTPAQLAEMLSLWKSKKK